MVRSGLLELVLKETYESRDVVNSKVSNNSARREYFNNGSTLLCHEIADSNSSKIAFDTVRDALWPAMDVAD